MLLPTLLHSGFDTLDVAFRGCLQPQAFDQLAEAKQLAQDNGYPTHIDLGPAKVPIQVLRSGRQNYTYQTNTGKNGIIYCFNQSNDPNQWNIFVNIGSAMLLQNDYHGAKAQMFKDLKGMGALLVEESINRVDYCFDFLMEDFSPSPAQMVAPKNSKKGIVIEGRYEDDKSMMAFRGRNLETITVGKMPNRQIQLYDKRHEVISKQKFYWFDRWGIDRKDRTKQVWRVEIRAGKNHLKSSWGLSTFKDIEDSFGDVAIMALKKIRYIGDDQVYDTVNVTRAKLHPIWAAAQKYAATDLFSYTSGLCPNAIKKRCKEQMKNHAEISILAHSIRLGVSIEMAPEDMPTQLPIEVYKFLQNSIEKNPIEFETKINRSIEKTRLI